MDNETRATQPQRIYSRWVREGDKFTIDLTKYDYVIIYRYKDE